jgi:hypothetical protein
VDVGFLSGQEEMSEINPDTVFPVSPDISSIRSKCFVEEAIWNKHPKTHGQFRAPKLYIIY